MLFFDYDMLCFVAALGGYCYYRKKKANKKENEKDPRIFKPLIKNALLIGIDYEKTNNELKGCSKDIEEMNKFLNDKQYKTVLLCDDTERKLQDVKCKPTGNNIIHEMLDFTKTGSDNYFFHYSGHGTYVNDQNGDEDDRRDEVLVACDEVLIRDDDINMGFLARLPKSSKCFMLMDCCHSGTICDLRYRYVAGERFVIENQNDCSQGEVVSISGCMDVQTSADAFINNSYRGAMTTAFLEAYRINKGETTLKEHIELMRVILKNNGYEQVPQLSFNKEGLIDRPLNYFFR